VHQNRLTVPARLHQAADNVLFPVVKCFHA
jgi:hypothetical protein